MRVKLRHALLRRSPSPVTGEAAQMNKRKTLDEPDESEKSTKLPKSVHPFFLSASSLQQQQQQLETSTSSFSWVKSVFKTCIHGTHLAPRQSSRVAAFDLDGVLIKTKLGGTFPKDRNDWVWWRPLVKDKLVELDKEGYTIVVFSNQASTKQKTIDEWKSKVPLFAKELPNTPFRILAAQGYDWFRKPMPGMWLEFEKVNNISIDLTASFFIGDAAGRAGDHSDTDRKFALNIGLPFFTPEEYFLNKPPIPFTLKGVCMKEWPTDQPLFFPTSTPLIPPPPSVSGKQPNPKEVVLFVGYPASGKTTFYKRYFGPQGYKHINQDTLKTRAKCLKMVETCLNAGESCIVDNTNRDIETRKGYINLCKKFDVPIRCFHFTVPLKLCWHNNLYRTYSQYVESYVSTPSISSDESKTVSTTVSENIASGSTSVSTSESVAKKGKVKTKTIASATAVKMAEPLPPLAFTSYRAHFEEPSMEEGFSEIKRINFIYDDLEKEQVQQSQSQDTKSLWTKRRIWELWLEIGKLEWLSQ